MNFADRLSFQRFFRGETKRYLRKLLENGRRMRDIRRGTAKTNKSFDKGQMRVGARGERV